ncbi:MAG: carbohydrate binding domain-containing protein [Bacteroidetes bacterium]|nr:carbohydrate binding domain-containing protein [Bacteroidota bacterium]
MKNFLLAIAFCASLNSFAQNLVLNAGFETANVGLPFGSPIPFFPNVLDNWSAVNVDGEFMFDLSLAHSGTGFLSVLNNPNGNPQLPWLGTTNNGNGFDRVMQVVNVMPNTTYQLSFWVRHGDGLRYGGYDDGTLLVEVEEFTAVQQVIDSFHIDLTTAWTSYQYSFTTLPGTTSIALLFSCFGVDAADAWIDDVEVSIQGGAAPVVNFSSTDSVFCDKQCINFNDLSTNSPTSWSWAFTGANPPTSTDQNPTAICYNTYGTFNVELIACNAVGCDTLLISNFITEFQLPPAPTITLVNDTLYCSAAFQYQWFNIDSGFIILGTNNYFVPVAPGNYYALISDSNGCQSPSNVIGVTVGIYDHNASQQLIIHNQADNMVLLPEGLNSTSAFIFGSDGRHYSARIANGTIDISHLAAGAYVLILKTPKQRYSYKLIKTKTD